MIRRLWPDSQEAARVDEGELQLLEPQQSSLPH